MGRTSNYKITLGHTLESVPSDKLAFRTESGTWCCEDWSHPQKYNFITQNQTNT